MDYVLDVADMFLSFLESEFTKRFIEVSNETQEANPPDFDYATPINLCQKF